jgi:hypothetical protein
MMRSPEIASPGCGTGAQARVNLVCRYNNDSRFFYEYQPLLGLFLREVLQ